MNHGKEVCLRPNCTVFTRMFTASHFRPFCESFSMISTLKYLLLFLIEPKLLRKYLPLQIATQISELKTLLDKNETLTTN